ncbi:hypothetical protein MKX03_031776 [Papaver bracteatum]|nr:hypothetical protein MKX03_031776 [Papaver bracteatum]
MAERIYPAANPTPTQPLNGNANGNHANVMNGNGGVNQIFPPPKSQLYGENRPTYRPLPRHHRRRRILLMCLFPLVNIHRPTVKEAFYVMRICSVCPVIDFGEKRSINSKLNLTILAKSENKDMIYYLNPMNVSITPQNHPDVEIGSGYVPDFILGMHNRTSLRFVLSDSDILLQDPATANSLKSDMNKKNAFPIKVRLNTKVKVKMGVFNTRKVGLQVTCEHIKILSETKTITEVSKVKGGKNTTCNLDEKSSVKQN